MTHEEPASAPVHRRTAAIVGRPNVGKSALFNRLVRRRVAIVHEMAGVTRDRIIREALWDGQRFEVIDTGGLGFIDGVSDGDAFAGPIREQVKVAIEDASVLIFVVDALSGLTPLDEEVARYLHMCGRPVLLAANKVDNERVEQLAAEFSRLGFPVFPVSALHNLGVDRLLNALLERLPEGSPPAAQDALKVAVVGKPNAGKSSFLNRVLRSDRLIVSDVPGTTRDSVEIPFAIGSGPQARHYLLIDTAGLRHVRGALNAVEKYSVLRAEKTIEHADLVVLMMDGAAGPTLQDKKIAGLIAEHRKGCVVAINKWDLVTDQATMRAYEKALRAELPFLSYAPLVFLSAKTGLNVRKSIEVIDHVAAQNLLNLPTGTLNRVLHDAVKRVQPPRVQGHRMKFYYATQIGTKPVRLRLFVNNPEKVTDAYRSYLTSCLRSAYGLEGAPLVLTFRSSHED